VHTEELKNVYSSSTTINVIKSRRMIGTEHIARKGDIRNTSKVLIKKPEGRNHMEDIGSYGRIIL
jgi:hypothetical protein